MEEIMLYVSLTDLLAFTFAFAMLAFIFYGLISFFAREIGCIAETLFDLAVSIWKRRNEE